MVTEDHNLTSNQYLFAEKIYYISEGITRLKSLIKNGQEKQIKRPLRDKAQLFCADQQPHKSPTASASMR